MPPLVKPLLDFGFGASFFELFLGGFGVCFGRSFFDSFGRAIDQVFSETKFIECCARYRQLASGTLAVQCVPGKYLRYEINLIVERGV